MTNPFNKSPLNPILPVEIDPITQASKPTETLTDQHLHPDTKKDYIVVVNPNITIDALEKELEQDTTHDNQVDSNIIPDRPVDVADRRPGSRRQTHYWLTDAEAEKLRNDPRVHSVEWNPASDPRIDFRISAHVNQNFERAGLFGPSGDDRANFALYRCTQTTNTYGTGISMQADYNYTLDGSGVDVIIMDTGVQIDHPEWQDSDGVSRFQQIDWYAATGLPGTMPANFYSVAGDHATHVAGIVAGKTFGWAKNAKIYSMNILGADPVSITDAFDLMRLWHLSKSIDPTTGRRRPTIINASWGVTKNILSSGGTFDPYAGNAVAFGYQIWGGEYRGTPWSGYTMRPNDYALKGTLVGHINVGADVPAEFYSLNGTSSAFDALVYDLLQAGVHYVHAAGNDGTKSDAVEGADYNNYVNIISGVDASSFPVFDRFYYNRSSSPGSPGAINVGSIDAVSYDSTLENRVFYSGNGTAVDIYAPGTGIVSAYPTGHGAPYYWDNNYDQYNDSGTSMASPQVAGVLALYLQIALRATPASTKQWLIDTSIKDVLHTTGLDNDYNDMSSITGGPNRFLFEPYAVRDIQMMSGNFTAFNLKIGLKK